MALRRWAVGMLLLAGATQASALARGLADTQLDPKSLVQMGMADAALAARRYDAASDAYEAAIAADPRNKGGYIGLARVAEAQGLPGKAIRYYREALQIDPNDLTALEGQGASLARRGAIARAQANLDRLKLLCAAPCPAADRLATAIARGPDAVKTAEVTGPLATATATVAVPPEVAAKAAPEVKAAPAPVAVKPATPAETKPATPPEVVKPPAPQPRR
ncbi:tetratricopeptide repeat protein [Sandaracinobacteroides saxicola]|uniref:Tetratricopeptide repeat protein n=1 Tax=Sandaracinobacteroides saxicola TaxID=2759707 RepID=A0A7G5IEW3_9SPHN|nr:tetratricopeptide repeat protein [Sandaracinobacteroides saxicola]QMW21905.1 tetratricopeptide repeat protein [Sandaracinobacteroides saxicola]